MWNLDMGNGWSGWKYDPIFLHPVSFNSSVTLNSTNVFDGGAADATCGVMVELFQDAARTTYAQDWQLLRRGSIPGNAAGALALPVGSSDYYAWFGSASPTPGAGLINSQRSGGTQTNNRATYLGLRGTVSGPCGTPCPDIGCLPDGVTTVSGTLSPGHINWYTFCLAGDATDAADAAGQFLDITTAGSATECIALFRTDGLNLTFNYRQPSQLTYGIGRRAGIAGGTAFDGRNSLAGFAGLPAGTYYRSLYPDSTIFTGNVRVNGGGCPACGTADFNGDGDFGTDQDIETFFACLAGNCCSTCFPCGADFNDDGDFGTDADIESFFRVLAGGSC